MMVKKKLARFLSFRYVLMALILLILAGGLVMLPKVEKQEGIHAEQLLNKAISTERYVSTDELSDKIISQDPSFILVDVRDPQSFNEYSLPNAVNIPLRNLLDEEYEAYINQTQYDVIFYSNDNFYADQAWVLGNRLGYQNLRVLKGGINEWYNSIINPTVPNEQLAAEDFELYSTRKAASMFFGVMYPEQNRVEEPVIEKPAARKVVPVKKKKKRPVEGGC